MEVTLAERLLLLMLDDESGRNTAGSTVGAGLAGALLLDLVACGALTDDRGDLVAVPAASAVDPLLAEPLAVISASERPRNARAWVSRLPRALRPLDRRVARRLVDRGLLREEHRRLLGLVPVTRFPQQDPLVESQLRERLGGVLLGETTPAGDDGLLIALLGPFDLVKGLVPKDRRREARRRAKELGEPGAAGRAVEEAVQAAVAATMAAVVAAATAGTSAGSS